MEEEKHIGLFQGKEIRKTIYQDEWWFSVIDIVQVLTDQPDTLTARKYWNKLSQRLRDEGSEVVTKCHQLKLRALDGKMRKTDCSNMKGIFRIIQSIPSPKTEPLKLWLAQVGHERIQEIENPELATKRTRDLYKAKGYSDSWIEKRVRGIAIREDLTDEWNKRGVKNPKEYAILTAEISKAAFGLTPSQYKKYKGLQRENLRDHMNDLELIFSMLGEASTAEIAKTTDRQGFSENKTAAREGGTIAGSARKQLERKTKKNVATKENYLSEPEAKKKLK